MTAEIKVFLREQPQTEPQRFVNFGLLEEAVVAADDIFSSRDQAIKYAQIAAELGNQAVNEGVAVGAFGTGYPYYLLSSELPFTFRVNEIAGYLDSTREKIKAAEEKEKHGWRCPHCQVEKGLEDLKTECIPCEDTSFKPRDIFKALPDLDLVLLTPDDPDLVGVSDFFEKTGFKTSDPDIDKALKEYVEGHATGDPRKYILVDLHAMTRHEYEAGAKKIAQGDLNVKVPMFSYRGNGRWDGSERLPMSFDYLCAMRDIRFTEGLMPPQAPGNIGTPSAWIETTKNLAYRLRRKEHRMFSDPHDAALILPAVTQIAHRRLNFMQSSQELA